MNDATGNKEDVSPTPSSGTVPADKPADELIAKIIAALPTQVRSLAYEAPAWQVPSDCMVIAALTHLADALGNSQRVILPGIQRPTPFNMVFVADHAPGPGRCWLDLIGQPWLNPAQQVEFQHAAIGAKATAAEVQRLLEDARVCDGFNNPGVAKAVLCQAMRVNQPMTKLARACPRRLAEAMEGSFDRAVVSLNGGIDPARDLVGSSRTAPNKLATLLADSWQRQPLKTGKGHPLQGSLTVLWQSTRREIRPLLFGPTRPWAHTPPPVLFLRQQGHATWFPDRDTPAFKGWAGLLAAFFDLRCATTDVSGWSLPPEAWPLLTALHHDMVKAAETHPGLGRFLLWMPELAIPLALVLTLAKGVAPDQSRSEGQGNAITLEAMNGAIAITRWLMERQIATLEWIRGGEASAEPDTSTDDGTDNFDVEAVMEAVPRIIARRGPLTRLELLRSFHKLDARTRDAALRRLIARGQIRENCEKRLELVTAAVIAS